MDSRTGKMITEDEHNELSESEKRYFFKLDYEAKKEIERYDRCYKDIKEKSLLVANLNIRN